MMSQFGKNPPWARNVGPINQTAGLALTQPQLELVPQVYGQAAVAAPTMFSIQPGIALPTTLASSHVATVTYPSPRPVAASALQHKQRVFTGTVTKLHENFGFVDEDVFFQTSCVNGQQPNLGDRVLVEATYNANMPVKWNATRIQVLTTMMQTSNTAPASQGFQAVIAQPVYSSIASASQGSSAFHSVGYKSMAIGSSSIPNLLHHAPPLMSKQTQAVHGRGSNLGSSARRTEASAFKDRVDRVWERASSRERRERRSPRKRSRSPRRSRSPLRSRSPQKSPVSSKSPPRSRSPHSPSRAKSPQRARRSIRVTSRYTVQIPKISLDLKEANLMTLRSRYNNMYIPSDFFNASFLWTDVFPAHRPFTLGNSCDFHIFSKSVTPPTKLDSILDPLDADYRFNVKVMLLTCPTLEDLYHKSCALAEDASEVRESFQHPTRLIQFLVGLKGKGEPVALGGPWSPSLDGSNPEENPRVLINTAVRTTKALTGIDLSHCMQWFRFTEIRYYRPEEVRKGRTVPAHTETVVIFLPDVWTCRPTHLEWQTLMAEYRKLLDVKLSTEEFRLEPKAHRFIHK